MNSIQDPIPTRSAIFAGVVQAALVFLVVCFTFSFFINAAPLAGTEAHRAIPAHQLLQSGDWIVPRFWGVPYLAKPPLHYWLLALSEAIFQTNAEWVFRLPSILAAALTATTLFLFTRRHFPAPAPLIAGLSFLALLALWSQNIKADIDANHTLAVTLATLGIIELGIKNRTACPRSAFFWTALTTGAFAAVLLLKGPAGLPVILGACLGPAVLLKKATFIRRPHILLSLFLGTGIFISWILAVRFNLNSHDAAVDRMGIAEVWRNLTSFNLETILATLTLPIILFVYTLPHSAITLLAARQRPTSRTPDPPSDDNDKSTPEEFNDDPHELVKIIGVTLLTATACAMLARLTNPRYMYIAFPLLCPIVGLQLSRWLNRHPIIPPSQHRILSQIIIATAILIPILNLTLAISTRLSYQLPIPVWMLSTISATIILSVFAVRGTIIHQKKLALIAITISIISYSPTYSYSRTQDRRAQSSFAASFILRQIVGPKATVYSGNWIRNGPELPYYADVEVIYRLKGELVPETTPANVWVLFQDGEYRRWVEAVGEQQFEQVTTLPTRRRNAIIARYLGPPANNAENYPERP